MASIIKVRKTRRKVCSFCADRVDEVNYKEINRLRRYITDRGKIASRRQTGLCPKHQRSLARAVKRARVIGFVPYIID